ncbi:pantoate--beta-alanine ligase [Sporolactobacillus pectinivorans]|uniref:pantoate--beta-alanine ligase n=1 Tax=Sporolactobacillus pectinivorans TaxID=1591408 RepID=UPI003B84A0EE
MNKIVAEGLKRMVSPAEVARFVTEQKQKGKTVGFVPTMGALHEGHLSLFKRASESSDCVIASVFVNPTQFGDKDDYINYPKNIDRDAALAERAGVDVLFIPEESAIYPNGSDMTVQVHTKTDVLCGKSRPGHFDGVATVLTKLFNIVKPDTVYFGMKDAQQVAIVSSLIRTFHIPVKLVACPIVRESDGLAKSSRNVRLSANERKEAPEIYKGLQAGLRAAELGERNFDRLISTVKAYYAKHLILGKIDYVDVLNYPELKRSGASLDRHFIIACAVRYQSARLIDNITADTEKLLSSREAD